MRRVMLTVATVAAVFVGAGLIDAQRAEAAPGYFNFSVGTPAYYPYGGYPYYASYPYSAPVVPQAYVAAGVPVGVRYAYPAYRYYPGYYGRPYGYGPYGYSRYRW